MVVALPVYMFRVLLHDALRVSVHHDRPVTLVVNQTIGDVNTDAFSADQQRRP